MTYTPNIYGSLDIQFDVTFKDSARIILNSGIYAVPAFQTTDIADTYSFYVVLTTETIDGSTYAVSSIEMNSAAIDTGYYPLGESYVHREEHVRFFLHNKCVSIYIGGRCVYSYIFSNVDYPTGTYTIQLSVQTSVGSLTFHNIKRVELCDYRDAVYVDYEATADSAMQSVIQERPVQIFSEPDRSLSFTYHVIKDILDAHHIREYVTAIQPNNNISSDGLIYYTNVSINTYQNAADEVGLITKLYRLSNLEMGAQQATAILQRLALERRYPIQLRLRLDPRYVIADQLDIDVVLTGTGTHITDSCIVEDIQTFVENGNYYQEISGRRLKT
jgi:hypothetical protein